MNEKKATLRIPCESGKLKDIFQSELCPKPLKPVKKLDRLLIRVTGSGFDHSFTGSPGRLYSRLVVFTIWSLSPDRLIQTCGRNWHNKIPLRNQLWVMWA